MSFPDATGWVPDQVLAGYGTTQPPQYILDAMGGSYDQSRYYWNPDNMSLVDRYTGGSYGYSHVPDPAQGTDVVTNLTDYNQTGQAQLHYDQGQNPYFGFGDSAQGYNAGDAPNSGMFISADPNAIGDYQSHREDVVNRGVGTVAALVGGAALGGALSGGGAGAPAGTTIGPNGLPTGAMSASGGGIGTMSGAVPGVGAAPGIGAAYGASNGLLDSSGSVIPGTAPPPPNTGVLPGAAAGAGGILDSSGAVIPGTEGYIGPLTNALGSGGGAGLPGIPSVGGGTPSLPGGSENALGGLPNWITDALLPGLNSLIGGNAADKAAEAQERAALAAIDEQRRQYDTTRADLQPWLTAGQGALGRLQDPNAFQASPSYDFRRSEGMRGIENSFAAGGMGQSGNALKALNDFNSNLASQEHGQWWDQQSSLAGLGQSTGTQLGNLGQNTAANVGNALSQYGDARASGYLGRSAALAGGVNDSMFNYLYRRQR